jgi:hypothetical protein
VHWTALAWHQWQNVSVCIFFNNGHKSAFICLLKQKKSTFSINDDLLLSGIWILSEKDSPSVIQHRLDFFKKRTFD